MDNLITKTTELALHLVQPYIESAPAPVFAIDATCGNGHDTLALAKMLFGTTAGVVQHTPARLLAIDIQPEAIAQTEALLCEAGFSGEVADGRISLICGSHADIHDHIYSHLPSGAKAAAIIFNLGYLPGGDKTITTTAETTIEAAEAALGALQKGGILSITMYSGHDAGAKEKEALMAFATELDSHAFHVAYISMPNQRNNPPEILLITKK